MEIKDKVVVITGASEGIGLAAARLLSGQGAKVVLAARSADKLDTLATELPDAFAIPVDLRNPGEATKLIHKAEQHYGRIDILINNAGRGIYGPVESVDINLLREVMELNLYAVIEAMQAAIPIMCKQGGGMIMNISSRVSKSYIPGIAAYAATKYALNAITLTARQELEKDNIIVCAMLPKLTATSFGVNAVNARTDERTQGVRLPGVDTAEDVAEKIMEQIISEEAEASM